MHSQPQDRQTSPLYRTPDSASVSERSATVLYNCTRCKVGRRVEYPLSHRAHIGYGRYETTYYRLSERGARVVPGCSSLWDPVARRSVPGKFEGDGACPQCQRAMKWGFVRGIHNPEVKCDARCTGARGHSCECSCGGQNHGAGWAMTSPIAVVEAA